MQRQLQCFRFGITPSFETHSNDSLYSQIDQLQHLLPYHILRDSIFVFVGLHPSLTDGEMITVERNLATRTYSDLEVFAESFNVKDLWDDGIDMELESISAF